MRALVAAVVVGLAFAASLATAAQAPQPPCPKVTISADGNASPLFCTIANPTALAFYRPLARHLFALTRSTSDADVRLAIALDRSRLNATAPEECQAFKLWKYVTGYRPVANSQYVMPGLC